MESTAPSPAEDAHSAILEDGFFIVQDPLLGQNIKQMDDAAIHFASIGGLQFCKANILDNPVIRRTLGSFFETSILGLYRSIGPKPPGTYTFTCDPNSSIGVLLVQLWNIGSRVTYWRGSHRHWLDPIKADNSLLRVPAARLHQLSLEPVTVNFEHGGFAILDARTAFEVVKGTATTFAFGKVDIVKTWSPMKLPKSLESVVAGMESTGLGMNAAFS
ncbi:hypothetical protein F5Y08DRAFT_333444 [Xylaria arbuscula]|nr:hypothetical protein F5Y08DRAFT_333444 [Xylaria arbuscula]